MMIMYDAYHNDFGWRFLKILYDFGSGQLNSIPHEEATWWAGGSFTRFGLILFMMHTACKTNFTSNKHETTGAQKKRCFKRQQPPILINSWKISPTWKHFKASTHRKSAKFDHIASLEVASFKYHPLCCNEWIPSQQFQVTNPTGANINLTNCSQITGKCPSSKQTRRFFRPKGLDQVDSSWLWFLQYLWLTRCLKHPMLLSRQAWPCR